MSQKTKNDEILEEITVKGNEAVAWVKKLVEKGNVRSLIVRSNKGEELFSLPLTAAVVGVGALSILAPLLAVLGVAAAYFSSVKIEVVRLADADDTILESDQRKNKIDIE